ncbi:hypothetical protein PMAYCL1PPCAC_31616, partial [Pristionchus mayeri]
SLDVVQPSLLSVLAWKIRDVGSPNFTCSKYRLKSGIGFFFQWERKDSDVHKNMINLMKAYLGKGARRACLDGNDFRSFCKILVGVRAAWIECVEIPDIYSSFIHKFAKYRNIDQLYLEVMEFSGPIPKKFLNDISSQFRTININSEDERAFFASDRFDDWGPIVLDMFTRKL